MSLFAYPALSTSAAHAGSALRGEYCLGVQRVWDPFLNPSTRARQLPAPSDFRAGLDAGCAEVATLNSYSTGISG